MSWICCSIVFIEGQNAKNKTKKMSEVKVMLLKRIVDLLMMILLLLLMAFQVTGETAHEWLGIGMFVLFLIHQWLNRPWYRALFRGRYGLARVLRGVRLE